MNLKIRSLQPEILWNNFADLNTVPRPSKSEQKVVAFMIEFGKKLGLETLVDDVQNVIIKKPATFGMENNKSIVLQAHLDMVCQKNADVEFNFDTQGIKMYINGDWVRAKGTTLGADNGIGVSAIMSILASTDISHPAIEALFTVDEETGMTGAKYLQPKLLNGEILLNLDTEDDSEIGIGCAGGIDITAEKSYQTQAFPEDSLAYNISLIGLQGGHSGMDINKGLGNANKLINRILIDIESLIHIAEINGGGLRNAIPRESFAVIVIKKSNSLIFEKSINKVVDMLKHEYKNIEPHLSVTWKKTTLPSNVATKKAQKTILRAILEAHNGVYRMSPDIKDLVETSNNISRITLKEGTVKVFCLTRSSIESNKTYLVNSLKDTFELAGFKVNLSGDYPGWQPNMSSPILKILKSTYIKLFNHTPNIEVCHAGLECGILAKHYPDMDMISFGPTIKGAHSPDERASISSTQKFWRFLKEVLVNIPTKD